MLNSFVDTILSTKVPIPFQFLSILFEMLGKKNAAIWNSIRLHGEISSSDTEQEQNGERTRHLQCPKLTRYIFWTTQMRTATAWSRIWQDWLSAGICLGCVCLTNPATKRQNSHEQENRTSDEISMHHTDDSTGTTSRRSPYMIKRNLNEDSGCPRVFFVA